MPRVSFSRRLPISFTSAVPALRTRRLHLLTGRDDGRGSLSTSIGGTVISRPVRASVGDPEVLLRPIPVAVLPFRLEADDHPGWTPILLAELEVVGERHGVELTLDGEYRLPGGVAGSVVDRLGMHRVAERGVELFFADVADRLESGSAAGGRDRGLFVITPGPLPLIGAGEGGLASLSRTLATVERRGC